MRSAGKTLLRHTADIKAVVLVVVVLRVGIGSVVVEVVRVGTTTISSTRPVVAVGTVIVQATTTVVAGTREIRGELNPDLAYLLLHLLILSPQLTTAQSIFVTIRSAFLILSTPSQIREICLILIQKLNSSWTRTLPFRKKKVQMTKMQL